MQRNTTCYNSYRREAIFSPRLCHSHTLTFLAVSAALVVSQLSSADRAMTPSQQVFVVERSRSQVRSSGLSLPAFLRDPTLSIDSLILALKTRLFAAQRDT